MSLRVALSTARCRALALASLCCLAAASLQAQSDSSTISGFVRDQSGAGVPNATVLVRNEASGLKRRAQTDTTGFYAAPNLPSGMYTVAADAPDFKRAEVRANKLDASVPLQVSVALSMGDTKGTIEVTAAVNEVQSESAVVGRIVTREPIENLQLNGRNPALFAQLLPGVVRSGPISSFTFGLESQFNINGAPAIRTRAATFPVGVADLDSTQEVQVLTARTGAGRAQTRPIWRPSAK